MRVILILLEKLTLSFGYSDKYIANMLEWKITPKLFFKYH